ncbi:hypothetical protein TNCV_1929511 [Trichonephila clavipes]|nr:hypothetical protein TNCV_1929511 [Trichonephila clavipes]
MQLSSNLQIPVQVPGIQFVGDKADHVVLKLQLHPSRKKIESSDSNFLKPLIWLLLSTQEVLSSKSIRAVGSLVVKASESRPDGLGSMPDPSEYTRNACSLNQTVRKSCGWSQQKPLAPGLENIPLPSSSMSKLWRWTWVVLSSVM